MRLLTWNIRGFNDPLKAPAVKALLGVHDVNIIGLIETKVKAGNAAKVQKRLGQCWQWLDNYTHSSKGRIWLGWKSDALRVNLIHTHEQFIQCLVQSHDKVHQVHLTVVYGLNTVEERRMLWKDLGNTNLSSGPHILAGDFNTVLNSQDRINGRYVTTHELRDFQDFLQTQRLYVMDTKGPYFTWSSKGQGDLRVSSRIDWGVMNDGWVDNYNMTEAVVLPPSISDHSPLLLDCFKVTKGGGRPFRFLNIIAEHKDFNETVAKNWNTEVVGSKMFQVWTKLNLVKQGIKQLHTNSYGNLQGLIDEATSHLGQVQIQLSTDTTNIRLQQQEDEAIRGLKQWLAVQESIFKQKSRIEWLKLGDSNNHFFFAAMKHRTSRNRIDTIYTQEDVLLDTPDLVKGEITHFYKLLLGTSAYSLTGIDLEVVRKGPQLSYQSQMSLIAPVTHGEIDAALKNIKDSKAPGPDGFNALFFKKSWPIIKNDIYGAIEGFFQGKPMLKQWFLRWQAPNMLKNIGLLLAVLSFIRSYLRYSQADWQG